MSNLKIRILCSISLKGAAIDDLTFKKYNIELEGNKKVTLIGPELLRRDT